MGSIRIVWTENCTYGVEICSFFIVKTLCVSNKNFRRDFFNPNCSNTPIYILLTPIMEYCYQMETNSSGLKEKSIGWFPYD